MSPWHSSCSSVGLLILVTIFTPSDECGTRSDQVVESYLALLHNQPQASDANWGVDKALLSWNDDDTQWWKRLYEAGVQINGTLIESLCRSESVYIRQHILVAVTTINGRQATLLNLAMLTDSAATQRATAIINLRCLFPAAQLEVEVARLNADGFPLAKCKEARNSILAWLLKNPDELIDMQLPQRILERSPMSVAATIWSRGAVDEEREFGK